MTSLVNATLTLGHRRQVIDYTKKYSISWQGDPHSTLEFSVLMVYKHHKLKTVISPITTKTAS
jgi:hypothetical protein